MGYYDNSGNAVPWLGIDSNRLGASRAFSLLPEVLQKLNYTAHAVGKWHLGHVTREYTPTYRGYSTFLGYYDATTENYWAHTHSAGANAPDGCPGPGLGGLWNALSDNAGAALAPSSDNGTYESTLFGDRAVGIIERHAVASDDATPGGGGSGGGGASPLFLYLAFHNEHDPHQAPRSALDAYGAFVCNDTYKVTVAQIATMDEQVGRVVDALNRTAGMLDDAVISFCSDNGGPLDHANNYPHRGGKHGFYEVCGRDDDQTSAHLGTAALRASPKSSSIRPSNDDGRAACAPRRSSGRRASRPRAAARRTQASCTWRTGARRSRAARRGSLPPRSTTARLSPTSRGATGRRFSAIPTPPRPRRARSSCTACTRRSILETALRTRGAAATAPPSSRWGTSST